MFENKNFISNFFINSNINNFLKLYKNRPVKNNQGGMLFQHMFFTYLLLKKIKPKKIIESGVFKGQSTWLIRKTLPNARICSIDIDLSLRQFIDETVDYLNSDFSENNFKGLDNSLLFLDDHINHYERIKDAYFKGIKNIILEDNYMPLDNKSDFYTLNHIINKSDFIHKPSVLSLLKTYFKFNKIFFKKLLLKNYNANVDLKNLSNRIRDFEYKNNHHANLSKIVDFYFIFPKLNLNVIENENLKEYSKELSKYNFLTFLKLK